MIDESNYSRFDVRNNIDQVFGYDDEGENIYEFADALACIASTGGIDFPNVQSIITDLFEQGKVGDGLRIADRAGCEVYLVPTTGHDMYEEAVYIGMGLDVWAPEDADGYSHGGTILEVEACWERECNPASESETRKMLRWVYECLIAEWDAAFSEWSRNGFSY